MKRPNFFIVGAPRCGTTSMSEYLRQHPQVFFSSPKEPNYFNTDVEESFRKRKLFAGLDPGEARKRYLQIFETAGNHHKAVGEGTVFYLKSEVAPGKIRKFNPEARLIVMLRNPVDAVYSWYNCMHNVDMMEDVGDFEKAWDLQHERAKGELIPPDCEDVQFLKYREMYSYGEQMERLFEVFPEKQVLIIYFNELRDHPRYVYRKTLKFLGLKPYKIGEFRRYNQSRKNRNAKLLKFLLSIPNREFYDFVSETKRRLGIKSLGVSGFWSKFGTRKKKLAMSPRLRKKVYSGFREDIKRLENVLERRLDGWKP